LSLTHRRRRFLIRIRDFGKRKRGKTERGRTKTRTMEMGREEGRETHKHQHCTTNTTHHIGATQQAEQSRAEQSRAEQSRAEQSRAEQTVGKSGEERRSLKNVIRRFGLALFGEGEGGG